MAKFDEDKEIQEIVDNIKTDLSAIDETIEELLKEAVARQGNVNLKYHDVATPLTKLISSKQKYLSQLVKILDREKEKYDDEVEFDLDAQYEKFEKVEEQ